jgi:hypothetical protein
MAPKCEPGTLPPSSDGEDGYYYYNNTTCAWEWIPFATHTPIIIDTDGSGFHLTSAPNGVLFDFSGMGKLNLDSKFCH